MATKTKAPQALAKAESLASRIFAATYAHPAKEKSMRTRTAMREWLHEVATLAGMQLHGDGDYVQLTGGGLTLKTEFRPYGKDYSMDVKGKYPVGKDLESRTPESRPVGHPWIPEVRFTPGLSAQKAADLLRESLPYFASYHAGVVAAHEAYEALIAERIRRANLILDAAPTACRDAQGKGRREQFDTRRNFRLHLKEGFGSGYVWSDDDVNMEMTALPVELAARIMATIEQYEQEQR